MAPPPAAATTTAINRTLTVLYYKRSSKVHKTGKLDGWLTINAATNQVVLRDSPLHDINGIASSSNGSSNGGCKSALSQSDDEEEEEYSSKKAKWNAIRKSKHKLSNSNNGGNGNNNRGGVIYTAIHREIVNKLNELREDDVLIVGPWECQIISLADDESSRGDDGKSVKGAATAMNKGIGKSGALMNSNRQIITKHKLLSSKKSLIGIKRPLSSSAGGGGIVKKPTNNIPKFKSAMSGGASSAASAAGTMKRDKNGEWYLDQPPQDDDDDTTSDNDDDDEEDTLIYTHKPATKIPKTLMRKNGPLLKNSLQSKPSTILKGYQRNIPSNAASTTTNNGITSTASTTKEFPGAIGTIHIPASIQKILRPHQREGITFLWNCVTGSQVGIRRLYRNANENGNASDSSSGKVNAVGAVPRGAVLADEMGLGKTLMTISTIYALHRQTRTNRFIVVCPSSLVSNWSKEFDKWLGKASNPKRVIVRSGAEDGGLRSLKSFVMNSAQAEVLILSYELMRLHVKVLCKAKKIGLLVVDEGHRLKNTSGSQTLSALNSLNVEARILITGTPIQNNLGEFYNVANFALPGILGDLSTFRRLYERPLSAANKKNATREEKERGRVQSKALDEITKTFLLRRLQKDVLKSLLPPRMELLLFCRPSPKQCEMYRNISDRAAKSIGSIGGRDENPLMLLTELRKLCTHPLLLEKELPSADNGVELSGKMVVLSSLIDSIREHNPTDKVVIISNFTSALTVVESSILRKKSLSYVRLDGTVELSARQPMVDSFNNGSVNHSFAFLLSSKAGGCGLNLIGANRLIMLDADWNPATDAQAMARIYRQGQKKPCFLYRMFTTGTVEEVIFQRQLTKGSLAQLANDGGKSKSNSNFSPEELRDCFTLKEDCKSDTKNKLGKKWSDYCGASSLEAQGCEDQPLLSVCEDLNHDLSFVRVVDDAPDIPHETYLSSDDSDDKKSSSDSSIDSSDEEEFDG